MPPVFHVGLLMWLSAMRMPHQITDVASSTCPWRYWIVISVMTVQYRHRRLWWSQWIRHVRSSTMPRFWRSIFRHKIVIDQPLWWFSDEIRGSLVNTFLVVFLSQTMTNRFHRVPTNFYIPWRSAFSFLFFFLDYNGLTSSLAKLVTSRWSMQVEGYSI
jgi:hypothetical protein